MMDKDRIVYRVFQHRFATANSGLCAEVRNILGDHTILHEHRLTSNQSLGSFARFIKSKILKNAYAKDYEQLSKSNSAEVFRRLYFHVGTYLKARPQAFRFGREPIASTKSNECDRRYEGRKSRTGFYQALLGKHPMHFMNLKKCPHCGTSHDSFNILDHSLFECDLTHSKRIEWISHLENDILNPDLPDNQMNTKLFNILKETTLPLSERHHQIGIYKLIAFGGHDVQRGNGTVVTRRRLRRLGVSDVLSFHTRVRFGSRLASTARSVGSTIGSEASLRFKAPESWIL